MEDTLRIYGTPLEKMVLMLNDKIDALHARVDEVHGYFDSARHAIPWAGNGTMRHQDPVPPEHIDEWTRRGWDVWRVTMPCEPQDPPLYEITNRRMRAELPTTALTQSMLDRIKTKGEDAFKLKDNPIVRELLTSDVS